MKVIPRIKSKALGLNEVRIITVNEEAVEELLLENLMEKCNSYFNVAYNSDNMVCVMNLEKSKRLLTYAIVPINYCLDGHNLNFDYIREKVGITTKSLFTNNRYRSLTITDEMLFQE